MAETLASFALATADFSEYTTARWKESSEVRCGWRDLISTLLSPEGTTHVVGSSRN